MGFSFRLFGALLICSLFAFGTRPMEATAEIHIDDIHFLLGELDKDSKGEDRFLEQFFPNSSDSSLEACDFSIHPLIPAEYLQTCTDSGGTIGIRCRKFGPNGVMIFPDTWEGLGVGFCRPPDQGVVICFGYCTQF